MTTLKVFFRVGTDAPVLLRGLHDPLEKRSIADKAPHPCPGQIHHQPRRDGGRYGRAGSGAL